MYDQRVDRLDTDTAAVEAAQTQRDAAKSAVEAAERINSILTDLTSFRSRIWIIQFVLRH
jgi:hypothetical protein